MCGMYNNQYSSEKKVKLLVLRCASEIYKSQKMYKQKKKQTLIVRKKYI